MALKTGKAKLKKEVDKDKKKLEGYLGLAKTDLEACAKKMISQGEDMSMSEAIKILDLFNSMKIIDLSYEYSDIGGIAIDNSGSPLTKQTLGKAEKADCILLGAVGAKKYENNDQKLKPEYGLLFRRFPNENHYFLEISGAQFSRHEFGQAFWRYTE